METPHVREATHSDLDGILAIYNDVIQTSTAVYSLAPATVEERRAWFDARRAAGYPVLVACRDAEVLGFSSFGEFRGAWPGYRYSVEHSVHVRSDCRGQGLGSRLVEALFRPAADMGKHVVIGGIDAANEASLRMHERLGFQRVAHFREVGHKFGRWLDLVFVQRFIDAPGAPRAT
jgi:L-amino acid N-acyltransferase